MEEATEGGAVCLCQAGKLGPWEVCEKENQGVCARMCRRAHTIVSLCGKLGMQVYGIHRCLYTGSLCLTTGMCVLVFFFLNLGKVGFMLTNLNWSGWMLATDMISPT